VSASDRLRRPPLERTQPIRAWSTIMGGGPLNAVVSRSVELGYRVIDDYIRQGQKAAQRFNDRSYGPEAFTGDVQDLGARMAQYTSDFVGLWLDFMQVVFPGALGGAPAAGNGARATPATDDRPPRREAENRTRVRIEVASTRPTEVSVDLRPDAVGRRLVVQGLHGVDPGTPKLGDVALEADPDGAPLRVRVRVPDDVPRGTYNGVIVDDETSRPVGTLSVRVGTA
jgi:hypothetical protein